MFLHRLFGYRGVVLFPWHARVYDRDMDKIIPHGEKFPNTTSYPKNKYTQKDGQTDKKELKGRSATYYQVSRIETTDILVDFIDIFVYFDCGMIIMLLVMFYEFDCPVQTVDIIRIYI